MDGEFDADLVFGGPGNDEIGAGFDPDDPGDDVLFGGSGDVVAFAAAGNDRLLGGPGDDGPDGGPGFDRLNGQAGVDRCVNGEVLRSCEATAAAGQPLATAARAAGGYGRR